MYAIIDMESCYKNILKIHNVSYIFEKKKKKKNKQKLRS